MEVKDLSTLNDDLAIIQKLEDEPNDMGGMSATELKEAFDRSGLIIQAYINNVLIPELQAESGAASLGMVDPESKERSSIQMVLDQMAKNLKDVLIESGALPLGGAEGQLLQKASGDNYDAKWGGVLESQLPDYLTRAKQLSAATAALFGLDADAVPDDAWNAVSEEFTDAYEEIAKNKNVYFISYIGTGTYGESNPCTVTFEVAPKVVFWFNYDLTVTNAANDSNLVVFRQGATSLSTANSTTYANPATWSNDGKTVSWYNTASASNQWNMSGKEYLMVALA